MSSGAAISSRRASLAIRLATAIAILGGALTLGALLWRAGRGLVGDPSAHIDARWHEGHRVLDRRGAVLRELPSDAGHRGQDVPLAAMGERVVAATLVAEDRSFYAHEGVNLAAIARAVAQNVTHGRLVSGASTITQQLVKLLDNEGQPRPRTLVRKIEEAARAENLERVVDKHAILEAYLNRLSYGHGLAGPEAAALGYFGKHARDLSWAEAAWLAVIPRAPSYLDPYTHADRIAPRQRALLDALRDEGLLAAADHARAISETITPRRFTRPFHAPHFVEMLRAEGRLAEGAATRATLDLDLQRDVEGLVRTHLAAIAGDGATSAAAIVVEPASGEVLAWVGSADFDDPSIAGQVDLVRAKRQPGSTLKPFVYALAFARGTTGADLVPDVPSTFPEGAYAYAPGNFDGTFEGPVSAREALAGSLNVPAIRLAAELPQGLLLDTLRELGFLSLEKDAGHYGLALALGSGEVELREVAEAYTALARGGDRVPLRVTAEAAELGRPASGARVLDAGVAASLAEILSDPIARVRGLHGRGPFDLGYPVAVKTGTSSGFRDTWSAGFTRERVVVVWVGNASGAPTKGLTGASGAGPLFADVMRRAMREVPARAPLWDASLLEPAEVCPLSGKRVGPACADHATGHFVRGHAPTETCDLHVFARPRDDAAPGEPPWRCDPEGASRVVVLPADFDAWLGAQPLGAPGRDPFGLPWLARARVPGCAAPSGDAELRVDAPALGTVFLLGAGGEAQQGIEIRASLVGGGPGKRLGPVELVVDGRVAARVEAPPYRAVIPAERGDHEILARPADPRAAIALASTRFSVR